MRDIESDPYRVNPRNAGFEVVDAEGQVMLVCQDQHSAENYAVLLNQAYQRGYKAGYRQARKRG